MNLLNMQFMNYQMDNQIKELKGENYEETRK